MQRFLFTLRFLPALLLIVCLAASCESPAPKAAGLPSALGDSALIVRQNGKVTTLIGTWIRPELDDASDRLLLSDGTCLLMWYCSYNDTLGAQILHAAEPHLLGKKVRITARYLREMPDTCEIRSRIRPPFHCIGYIDNIRMLEADSSNAI